MTKKATGAEHKPNGAAKRAAATGPLPSVDADQIRADIERTRGDLGETMERLADKADVKARANEAADHAKAQVREKITTGTQTVQRQSGELAHKAAQKATEGVQRARRRPSPVAATAAGVAAAAGILALRRRWAAKARVRRAAKARARRRLWWPWRLWQ
jgi:hypothetical protein